MDKQLIGQNLNGYIVGRSIGGGGMGRVYQALESETQTPVALKILLPEYAEDEQFRSRFTREAQLMIALRHANIVPVYAYGEWQGYLYIVMKLVKGPSLDRILEQHPFSPLTAWQIVRPVGAALHFGHEHNVMHRDLKPGNILVERHGEGNHVYIADFGLGKRPGLDTTLTAAGLAVGTPEYMASEAAMGEGARVSSDVYSFGVIIYELLLGRLPFDEGQPQLTALAHVDQPVPRPRRLHPQFPARLESVILRALEKDPTARYPSVEALQQAYYGAVKELDEPVRRATYWVVEPGGA
ncbi:MAG: serine/threonine protein kinase [Anaerolineae bacterium]|nr:serine/threonine protein kinase [Anaerolineae bacterium]